MDDTPSKKKVSKGKATEMEDGADGEEGMIKKEVLDEDDEL